MPAYIHNGGGKFSSTLARSMPKILLTTIVHARRQIHSFGFAAAAPPPSPSPSPLLAPGMASQSYPSLPANVHQEIERVSHPSKIFSAFSVRALGRSIHKPSFPFQFGLRLSVSLTGGAIQSAFLQSDWTDMQELE